jgi:hypothetical protein
VSEYIANMVRRGVGAGARGGTWRDPTAIPVPRREAFAAMRFPFETASRNSSPQTATVGAESHFPIGSPAPEELRQPNPTAAVTHMQGSGGPASLVPGPSRPAVSVPSRTAERREAEWRSAEPPVDGGRARPRRVITPLGGSQSSESPRPDGRRDGTEIARTGVGGPPGSGAPPAPRPGAAAGTDAWLFDHRPTPAPLRGSPSTFGQSQTSSARVVVSGKQADGPPIEVHIGRVEIRPPATTVRRTQRTSPARTSPEPLTATRRHLDRLWW